MKIEFLTFSDVCILHEEVVKMWGGLPGIRDEALLDSAVAYPLFLHHLTGTKDMFELAAAYCMHIIKNHAFIDGNKRTGILAMLQFLKINNVTVDINHASLYQMAIDVAASKKSEEDIIVLLKQSVH